MQELVKRQAQLEEEHQMLLRHHESTRDLEFKHLECIQRLRDDHLRKQHETERRNQQDYTQKSEQDLRKKHALQQKAQPRSLRVSIEHKALKVTENTENLGKVNLTSQSCFIEPKQK